MRRAGGLVLHTAALHYQTVDLRCALREACSGSDASTARPKAGQARWPAADE